MPLAERYTRKIKAPTGNGTTSLKITPTPGHRLHGLLVAATYAGGTNTVAGFATNITEIRVKVGTRVRWRLSGTQLRDYLLLHGTTYDWTGNPNTETEMTIPLAPEWYLDNVQDSLAWDPSRLGGDITVELDSTANLTVTAYEIVSDDLGAASSGIITLEVIKPVAGGTAFYMQREIDIRGRLLSASIYPDSTNSNAITPASLYLGPADIFAHETLSASQNTEMLNRYFYTPAASGRTANIYDIVSAKADKLDRAWDLVAWGDCKIKVEAAGAMAGTCSTTLARLESV